MSELKATTVYDAYWTANSVGEGTGELVYLKSEADKVIADKDKEIARLKSSIAPTPSDKTLQERLNEVCEKHGVSTLQDLDWAFCESEKGRARDLIEADKVIVRHKYKRCLAMAYVEWLKQMTLCKYPESILYRRAARRKYKWNELAEKFKEAK